MEPDIFLSYAREDERRAGELAAALKGQGYTVFWDRQIPIGQTWHSFVGEALRSAKCVVVAWSQHSIESDWVIEEAGHGKNRRVLMPVLIDIAEPPLGFGSMQAADLRDWEPGRRSQAFSDLLSGIARIMGPPSTAPPEPGPGAGTRQPKERILPTPRYGRARSWLTGGIALLSILAGGAAYWWFHISEPPAPDLAKGEPEAQTPEPQERVNEASPQEVLPSSVDATPAAARAEGFRDCAKCPLMVGLPAGTITMGSTDGYEYERPPHPVSVPAFAIGEDEVTFDDWDACVADRGCNGYEPNSEGWGRGRQPVINVSWEDAKAYVEWLSKATRAPYRLPSEAEWEYAARAGSQSTYWWGHDDPTSEQANFGYDVGKTTEAGSYPANPWGLHDMNGNVWEWVEDCWNGNYEAPGRPDDGAAWLQGDCASRVIRGGSWNNDDPLNLHSAFRIEFSSGERHNAIGFRVARTRSRATP